MATLGRSPGAAPLTSADIPDSSITTAKLADSSVNSAKIGVDVIVAEDIANNAVTVAELADNAVTQAKLADDAVGTAELANDVAISTTGAITTTGAFTSIGIDDNSNALAMTIDADENIGIGTATPDGGLTIAGGESSGGILNLWADEGDDNADKWRVYAGTSGGLYSESYSSGAWVNKFTVLNSGNVGIGTSAPAKELEIKSTTAGSHPVVRLNGVASSGAPYIEFTQDGTQKGFVQWAGYASTQHLAISTTSSTGVISLNSSGGNVGIGTAAPDSPLHVVESTKGQTLKLNSGGVQIASTGTGGSNQLTVTDPDNSAGRYVILAVSRGGSTNVFGSESDGTCRSYTGGITSFSDKRLKKNIESLGDGLDILLKFRPVTFEYNSRGGSGFTPDDGLLRYGFIADEILGVAPQYVDIKEGIIDEGTVTDMKEISMTMFIPMMFKAIQELSAKNDALEARILTLENA